jgi:hypothetical protein
LALGAAIAASFPLVIHLARGTTFSIDELDWFMTAPGLDLESALEPHNGHLVLTTRVVSKLILETLGGGYLPFLLLAVATTATLAVVLFVYASRRVGPLVALAPILVLVFFGSDTAHVATGNGFTVLFALVCGVGALLALERDDRGGDLVACALLVVGVATYTVALPFVVAAAVLVLLRGDRWRRAWIFIVPAALYGAWLLWARGAAVEPTGEVAITNALLFPSWAFQSLAAALAALVGVGYEFGGERSPAAGVGPPLALLAIGALIWRLRRRPVPAALWATLAALGTLWMLGALNQVITATPENPRYLYPVAVGVLLIAAWAVAGARWTRGALIALYAVAAMGLAVNLVLLRDGTAQLRSAHEIVRAEMGALEIAGERADPGFDPAAATEDRSFLRYPFNALADRGESPTELYVAATDRYGPVGLSPQELRERREEVRERADTVLVAALEIELAPAAAPDREDCLEAETAETGVRFELPPGSAAVLQPRGGDGQVAVRRFADAAAVDVGALGGGEAARLELPDDGLAEPWRISAPGTSVLVCPSQ